ncbi:MAG: hypothetical protein QOJ08_625 [Ilumatobacteraceae bacterium]
MDDRIDARIAALENEISRLKVALAGKSDVEPSRSDRRGMIKLLAASAVGAVTGAAILNAQPAAALDGDAFTLGEINEATSPTLLNTSDASALVLDSSGGYGVEANGFLANALFIGTGESPVALGLGGEIGALYVDGAGDWWGCATTEATNAVWRKLAGPDTAGQLHILPAPVRVYDSRSGQQPPIGPKSQTVPNEARTIDTTQNLSGVPTNANAVLITLTITGPQVAGFATAWPSGDWPGTSNVNFAARQDIAATAIVGCGFGGTIQVLSNAPTDFLVDVSGYYQ